MSLEVIGIDHLNVASARSSIERRLGVDIGALAPVDHYVEGAVEMVLDAGTNCQQAVTDERLLGWHAALFSTGYSGMARIEFEAWRDDATGPIQVISGPLGGNLSARWIRRCGTSTISWFVAYFGGWPRVVGVQGTS